jgi:hypothetical protein
LQTKVIVEDPNDPRAAGCRELELPTAGVATAAGQRDWIHWSSRWFNRTMIPQGADDDQKNGNCDEG